MPQISNGQLAERTVVAVELDPAIQNARRFVGAGDALELDPSPSRRRGLGDLFEQLLGPPPQGDELNPQPVQLAELGIGRQLGVEDQLLGKAASPLLPELDEAEDLIIPLVLPQVGVGVAEDSSVGVLGQERQHPLLLPAPLGDVVFLDQRILAVKGDRVEVEVKRCSPAQPQSADLIEPVAHQTGIAARLDAATVFGEERSLGDHVQAGEEGQPVVEDRAHDVAVARISEELQAPTTTGPHTRPGSSSIQGSRCVPAAHPNWRRPDRAGTGTSRQSRCGRTAVSRSSWRTSATSATIGRGSIGSFLVQPSG